MSEFTARIVGGIARDHEPRATIRRFGLWMTMRPGHQDWRAMACRSVSRSDRGIERSLGYIERQGWGTLLESVEIQDSPTYRSVIV